MHQTAWPGAERGAGRQSAHSPSRCLGPAREASVHMAGEFVWVWGRRGGQSQVSPTNRRFAIGDGNVSTRPPGLRRCSLTANISMGTDLSRMRWPVSAVAGESEVQIECVDGWDMEHPARRPMFDKSGTDDALSTNRPGRTDLSHLSQRPASVPSRDADSSGEPLRARAR